MLGKLLKYELKGTAHYFLPLLVAMLVFSILNRLFGVTFDHGQAWISGLLVFIEVVLIIAVVVMTMVITIQRFYKNLLGNEGYLMFTLPVSTHHNILSKLMAATLWNVAMGLMIALAIGILTWSAGSISEMAYWMWYNFSLSIGAETGLPPLLMLLEWTIVVLLYVAANILFLYLAMAIGQLFNEHKFLASFGAYIILWIAQAIALVILVNVLNVLPHSWFAGLGYWMDSLSPAAGTQLGTLFLALGALVLGGIYYFFTHRLLHKKLNLT